MEGGWFDPEAIESERLDADMEQAELEREGNLAARALRRMRKLRAAGKLAEAAAACTHGWTRGHGPWPRPAGAPDDNVCNHCGSVIRGFGRDAEVLEPCRFDPEDGE